MKKLLITALFGAFAVAQETTPEAAPSNHSLFYTVDLATRLDGDKYQGEHLASYSYKFADGYKLTPALLFATNYTKGTNGEWSDSVEHTSLRLQLDTPKYWDITGFKTGVRVRFILPTAAEDEGFGVVSTRLMMEREFSSSFNLTVIPKFNVFAQRNGYSRVTDPTEDRTNKDRNPLVGLALEILPQYKFSEDLTLTYDLDVSATYFGDSSEGDSNLLVGAKLVHEVELMYNIASAGDLGVGLFAANEFNFGNHKSAKFVKDDQTVAGVRLQKEFGL